MKNTLVVSSLFHHLVRVVQDTVRRGEVLSLKSNSDNKNWELQSSSGKTRTLPGACFMVPPPDAEALEKVNRYGAQTHHLPKCLCVDLKETLCVFVCSVWTKR